VPPRKKRKEKIPASEGIAAQGLARLGRRQGVPPDWQRDTT